MAVERGLTRRLGRELLLQAVYISLAVLVGVFVAAQLMENLLIEQALQGEADYYWHREEAIPGGPLPDTKNMTAYRQGYGVGVPADLAGLDDGFHRSADPRETLTLVTTRNGERLFLVFEVEQVGNLVMMFGVIPLAFALIVIYLSTYSAYRVSRRAVSPLVLLAKQVQQLDPAEPDAKLFQVDPAFEADDEIRVLFEALQDLVNRVLQFSERERRFTRDTSHELRTPLTVIKMAVDRLLRDGDLSEDKIQVLQRVKNSARDMEELTTAFLLLARESGQGLAADWVCVNDVVAAELERARIINPDSEINVSVDESCRLMVQAPEKVVESVVGNLLRNAFAYTDAGQVTVQIQPRNVTIEDTGPGMKPSEVEQVFQPYFRNQRQRGGFGVGLTIVKRLTDRFGWPIEIESEPARGTRISLEFPAARAE
ncbi:MAG: HAMP domain-containing histidine kinase [Xanthomonadales bacterium]|nr:HAMP domain-containing histidine kinase [Gammaproteobacteria bacterium]MBT8053410.1 HAMP domain-containing histidine kinase [Gammaproteobacteria bacterium]NND57443.1 HAMP domain-containing histidine kinase [Xanthomonadales bacterium]NNK52095.1 HAMP domain-containing histidine kinase [Xanthomonadales bacterium]